MRDSLKLFVVFFLGQSKCLNLCARVSEYFATTTKQKNFSTQKKKITPAECGKKSLEPYNMNILLLTGKIMKPHLFKFIRIYKDEIHYLYTVPGSTRTPQSTKKKQNQRRAEKKCYTASLAIT